MCCEVPLILTTRVYLSKTKQLQTINTTCMIWPVLHITERNRIQLRQITASRPVPTGYGLSTTSAVEQVKGLSEDRERIQCEENPREEYCYWTGSLCEEQAGTQPGTQKILRTQWPVRKPTALGASGIFLLNISPRIRKTPFLYFTTANIHTISEKTCLTSKI